MAYTKKQLDELTNRFESYGEKQEANKGSAVKVRATERDLLVVAEGLRDLCTLAVQGNKDKLVEVFGGTCEHLGRILAVLEKVELTEMHADDQRWEGCKQEVFVVKQILDDLGSYKPWQGKSTDTFAYPSIPDTFCVGKSVAVDPSLEGGLVENMAKWSVSPSLPPGLSLQHTTGKIFGTPTEPADMAEYVITAATDDGGETTTAISFKVTVPKPEGLSYPTAGGEYAVGMTFSLEPQLTTGVCGKYSVAPDLPAGLELDSDTGVISGTPSSAADTCEYTVSYSNSAGATSAAVSFKITEPKPEGLSYPTLAGEYTVGMSMDLKPELQSGSGTYTVSPALPAGLELDAATGVISGTPSDPTEACDYTVKVSNSGGETSAVVSFAVKPTKLDGLSYPTLAGEYTVGMSMDLKPELQSGSGTYTVSPALPAGLELDAATGVISGTPSDPTESCDYTVKVSNNGGETSAVVSFAVKPPKPEGLSYPTLAGEYTVGMSMDLKPELQSGSGTYTVSPALPAGLELDSATGVISGTPSDAAEACDYTVKVSNSGGEASAVVSFAVKPPKPEGLSFPTLAGEYTVGMSMDLKPELQSGSGTYTVSPALPAGLELDAATGVISGTPSDPTEACDYTVKVSNSGGETSAVVSFAVKPPKPEGLSYPSVAAGYTVGASVNLEPELQSQVVGGEYSVSPDLPPGLGLDTTTGIISGSPSEEAEARQYTVTFSNAGGSTTADIKFSVTAVPEIEEDSSDTFACMIEKVTDVQELAKLDPSNKRAAGDWMLWMVHRAWLNDPTLTNFNFDNMAMPLGHQERRIAPKLAKAIGHNTMITELRLNNSNLQKREGHVLAESMKKNKTIQILEIQGNNCDSDTITCMAQAIKESPECSVQEWRFDGQKCCGFNFGRVTEEALAQMLETNTTILKLGVSLNDPHWRRTVDKLLMRNNDAARKQRNAAAGRKSIKASSAVQAKDKTLTKLSLVAVPEKAASEVFEDDAKVSLLRNSLASTKTLPTKEQLQSLAKKEGLVLKFSEVGPLLKDFQRKLVQAFVETEVSVIDTYNSATSGVLHAWEETADKWFLDVFPDEATRFHFKSDKQIAMEVSDEVAAWIGVA